MYKSLVLIHAAAAAAASVNVDTDPFKLGMDVKGTVVSLTGVQNGTNGGVVLQAGRPSSVPGTTAWFIGTFPNQAVVLDLADVPAGSPGQHGLKVRDVGHIPGNVADVIAVENYGDFDFNFSESDDDSISHSISATSNTFYACKDIIDGEENYYLKWGNPTASGKAPAECENTILRKIDQ